MKVFTAVNPEKISNVYIVTDDDQKEGVIINPGDFSLNVYELVKSIGADIKKIIISHDNPINTNGIPIIKKIFDTEIYASKDRVFDFKTISVKNGSVITLGDLKFNIIDTPVHSYDSISILIENSLFVGDIIQAGYISSLDKKQDPTDFELKVIEKYILSLPDDTIIYPSKGPATTLKIEKEFNPFLQKRDER